MTPLLTEAEVRDFVTEWYRKLDVHAPLPDVLPLLAEEGLEFQLPEGPLHGQGEFIEWYIGSNGVLRKFFDETHQLQTLEIEPRADEARLRLVVRWEARRWDPPKPRSELLRFDATQHWVVRRSARTGRPVIATYVVDALTPLEGSPPL